MRNHILLALSFLGSAIMFGAAESLLWKRSLSLICLDTVTTTTFLLALYSVLFSVFLVSSLHRLFQILGNPPNPLRCTFLFMFAFALGCACFIFFRTLVTPVSNGGWFWTTAVSAGFSLPAVLLIWLFSSSRSNRLFFSLKCGFLSFLLFIAAAASFKSDPSVDESLGFGGFSVFRTILVPSINAAEPSPFCACIAGVAVGMLSGAFWRLFTNTRLSISLPFGSLIGGITSTALCISHLAQYAAVVGSGFSIKTAILAALCCNVALGLVASLSFIPAPRRPRVLLALLPSALYITFGIAYVHRAHSGFEVFKAAQTAYSYRTFVYMHYTAGGGWRRTSDIRSDDLKIVIYDRLINRYPHSMYRPEAMFERATAAYDAWRFSDAVRTLADLHTQYPGSMGPSRILHYLSLLADGQSAEAAHVAQSNDHLFQSWLLREGSRLAAIPYADLGLRSRATGLYSRYLDYLFSEHDGKWVASAARGAEDTITELQQAISDDKPRFGKIIGTVVAPKPIKGMHIALVKPQIDASSVSDSRQFTGPRTLPLWQGRSATVSSSGEFVIHSVPYGSYDIVVGLDAASLPERSVLEPLASPVTVDAPVTKLPPVRFIQAVELVSPKDGDTVSCSPVLSWRPHPRAHSYTVSVVATSPDSPQALTSASAYTCWSRADIRSTSVKVDSSGFLASDTCTESSAGRLLPERSYMWVVYACDAKGRIISSSEHYRLGREPSFSVAFSGSQNKTSTQNQTRRKH